MIQKPFSRSAELQRIPEILIFRIYLKSVDFLRFFIEAVKDVEVWNCFRLRSDSRHLLSWSFLKAQSSFCQAEIFNYLARGAYV